MKSHSFSPIQNNILSRLKNAKVLRYSDIQPKQISNDLFNYHLQFLVKKGFVTKNPNGYSLSDTGIKYMADPHTTNDSISSLFKMNVITIVSRKTDTGIEVLNQIRRSNPSYGKVGSPGGVVLKGETLRLAAARKLEEETGLQAEFRIMGFERRLMYVNKELFSDVLFPIAYADSYSGVIKPKTIFGENIWVPIDQAIKNESAEFDSIKSIVHVLKAVKNNSVEKIPLFFEETLQSDI